MTNRSQFIKQDSYEVGDFVFDAHGCIRYIYADDVDDLPYDSIAGKMLPEFTPMFEFKLKRFYGLDFANFWSEVEARMPSAYKMFSAWWQRYYKRMHLASVLHIKTNFYDLPFSMQTGILCEFFKDYGFPFTSTVRDFIWRFSRIEVNAYNALVCAKRK